MDPFTTLGWTFPRGLVGTWDLSGWRQPAIDVRDDGDRYEVVAELPGMRREDVELNIDRDMLEIRAESHLEDEEERGGYYRREIGRRAFYRTLPLPRDADPEQVEATMDDGYLRITFEKSGRDDGRRRRIEIR